MLQILIKRKRKLFFVCLIIFCLVIATFISINFFHKIEIQHEVVKDIYAAVVSIVLGSIVTLSLLYAQTLHDERKDKESEIFRQKIQTFNEFIDSLGRFLEDGELSQNEIRLLLLSRTKVLMHLKEKNQIIFDKAISNITYEIFFYDQWDNPDYNKLRDIFDYIKLAFESELYDLKEKQTLSKLDLSNFYQFSKIRLTYPNPINNLDEFLREIKREYKTLFKINSKKENEADKFYSFYLDKTIPNQFEECYLYLNSIISKSEMPLNITFTLDEKRVGDIIYMLNPKISYYLNDRLIMNLGVTNRARISLFLYDEKGARYKAFQLGDEEDPNLLIKRIPTYFPFDKIFNYLLNINK